MKVSVSVPENNPFTPCQHRLTQLRNDYRGVDKLRQSGQKQKLTSVISDTNKI